MAQWRLRDPGSFPPLFHEAMRAGPGTDKLIARVTAHSSLERLRTEWHLFRFSLRYYQTHKSAFWETRLIHRVKKVFNPNLKTWDMLLTSTPKSSEDIASIT